MKYIINRRKFLELFGCGCCGLVLPSCSTVPITERKPRSMADLVTDYGKFMETSTIPKLFINADPGSILTGRPREYCRTWSNQEEITVRGLHFIQEDSPDQICDALSDWLSKI